jgi:hypothetical protein
MRPAAPRRGRRQAGCRAQRRDPGVPEPPVGRAVSADLFREEMTRVQRTAWTSSAPARHSATGPPASAYQAFSGPRPPQRARTGQAIHRPLRGDLHPVSFGYPTSSSKALAWRRSWVSKPSVNQP